MTIDLLVLLALTRRYLLQYRQFKTVLMGLHFKPTTLFMTSHPTPQRNNGTLKTEPFTMSAGRN